MASKVPTKPDHDPLPASMMPPPPPHSRYSTGNQTAANVAMAREIADNARKEIDEKGMSDNHLLPVIPPGSDCWVGGDKKEVSGKVLQVIVGHNRAVQYQVTWWSGNDRKCEWLHDCEVQSISPNGPFLPIGFARNGAKAGT